ncbi:TetR/AcrR family transcriptional regulator [uncultured Williamsia sp.]|uniref:TetR/AcrR family transcriptional regulator n=1 Tax=uncultured Williamsia sp. TaxID=259311 RepID=UPI0026087DA2|nr:TetR/AcrR family transcriptional regulator [uncultured Williamsia sp.]
MRRTDPRPARSRAKIVDAAAALVRDHGPTAVAVDAVIDAAGVSRATFYRHFAGVTELVAAAFAVVIPSASAPSATGSVHERLTELVLSQARLFAEIPATTSVLAWLSLGVDLDASSLDRVRGGEGAEMLTLRERVADRFLRPFDEVLSSPDAVAELGDVDSVSAVALLLGPLAMGRLSTLPSFDYEAVARAAVDGFMAVHTRDS